MAIPFVKPIIKVSLALIIGLFSMLMIARLAMAALPPELDLEVVSEPNHQPGNPCFPAGKMANSNTGNGATDHAAHHPSSARQNNNPNPLSETSRMGAIDELNKAAQNIAGILQGLNPGPN